MKIECTFDSKIFHNPMNKYCIFRMKTDDPLIPKEARGDRIYPDHLIRFSAVGYELPMTDVVKLVLEGDWEKGKYGLQFVVEQWHEIVPETESGVYNYLSSGLLKGIGSKTAAEIVARFGINSLKVIENTPEKLLEIRGITPERLEEIKLSYAESRALRDIMTLLSPFKLTPKLYTECLQSLDRTKHMIEIKEGCIDGFFAFVRSVLERRAALSVDVGLKFQKSDFEGWAEL